MEIHSSSNYNNNDYNNFSFKDSNQYNNNNTDILLNYKNTQGSINNNNNNNNYIYSNNNELETMHNDKINDNNKYNSSNNSGNCEFKETFDNNQLKDFINNPFKHNLINNNYKSSNNNIAKIQEDKKHYKLNKPEMLKDDNKIIIKKHKNENKNFNAIDNTENLSIMVNNIENSNVDKPDLNKLMTNIKFKDLAEPSKKINAKDLTISNNKKVHKSYLDKYILENLKDINIKKNDSNILSIKKSSIKRNTLYRNSPVKHSSHIVTKKQQELFKRLFKEANTKTMYLSKNIYKKNNSNKYDFNQEDSLDSIIPDYIIKEHTKYANKVDKVNAYLRFNEYWRATPILKKDNYTIKDKALENEKNKEKDTMNIRIIRNYKDNLKLPLEKRNIKTKIRDIRQPILYNKFKLNNPKIK